LGPWLLFVLGCSWFSAPESPEVPPADSPAAAAPEATPDRETVLFVVIDTLRADHTSLCGYNRPTTPHLTALRERGATTTCRAYSPAPWTLPSHASYFSGAPVHEHGAQFVVGSKIALNQNITARPLAPEYETVAESFQGRGYQTALVSGNTILIEESGLLQGFDVTKTAVAADGALRGPELPKAVRRTLKGLDPAKSLFLFVNIFDAHDPYPAIPADVGWVPEREVVRFRANDLTMDNPFYRFIQGEMPESEAAPWLAHITDLYDYGVNRADQSFGRLLAILDETGFSAGRLRIIVTADHGEFLGEHHLLRHGGFLWEPVTNVPFLYWDSKGEAPSAFPEPFSAIHAFHLSRDGRLPDPLLPVEAVSEKDPDNAKVGAVACALWEGDHKMVWTEGKMTHTDLGKDKAELGYSEMPAGPDRAAIEALGAKTDTNAKRPPPGDNAAMTEQLKQIGYVE
jgi:hypothetical protein